MAGEGVLELIGPAGIVKIPRSRHGDVHVARFADGLAIVERLHYGELARSLLDQACNAEDVLGAVFRPHFAPVFVIPLMRSLYSFVNILFRTICHISQLLLCSRIVCSHVVPFLRLLEPAANEMVIGVLQVDVVGLFWCWRIVPARIEVELWPLLLLTARCCLCFSVTTDFLRFFGLFRFGSHILLFWRS